jgi:hypothetical protein
MEFALNPHLYPEGDALINEITTHLQCADAERILRSAYLIWRIIGTKLTTEQIKVALERLEQYVNEMRSTQWDSGLMDSDPYAPRFRDLLATLKTRYGSQQ